MRRITQLCTVAEIPGIPSSHPEENLAKTKEKSSGFAFWESPMAWFHNGYIDTYMGAGKEFPNRYALGWFAGKPNYFYEWVLLENCGRQSISGANDPELDMENGKWWLLMISIIGYFLLSQPHVLTQNWMAILRKCKRSKLKSCKLREIFSETQ